MKYMCYFLRISRLKQFQNTNYVDFDSLSEIFVEFTNLAD